MQDEEAKKAARDREAYLDHLRKAQRPTVLKDQHRNSKEHEPSPGDRDEGELEK